MKRPVMAALKPLESNMENLRILIADALQSPDKSLCTEAQVRLNGAVVDLTITITIDRAELDGEVWERDYD